MSADIHHLDRPTDPLIGKLFEDLALAAGKRIMEIKAGGFVTESKADESPVTIADREGEAIILAGLRGQLSYIPIVAEEEMADGGSAPVVGSEFILVDPLDGTKEFVGGRGDFTVNIALVRNGVPVIGAVYAPVSRKLYCGQDGMAQVWLTDDNHQRTESHPILARPPPNPFVIVASRSHCTPETDAIIARYPGAELVSVGSSLKFCLIAAGEADLYPRLAPTMQWDTAAGDAVLRNAGGMTRELGGEPVSYGPRAGEKPWLNPWLIAEGRRSDRAPA